MTIALLCIALLGVLLLGLGFAVSMTRGRTATVIGASDDPTDFLHKIVRAHGNTAEYVGLLAVLMLVLGSREPSTWATICMIGATAGRYLIAIGLVVGPDLSKTQPLRFAGALSTYVFGLGMCGSLLASL